MEKIILDCQKCGGHLAITQDMELFKCEFCGTPYMIKREEGTIRIIKLEEKIEKISGAVGALAELGKAKDEVKNAEEYFKDYRQNPLYVIAFTIFTIACLVVSYSIEQYTIATIAGLVLLSMIIGGPIVYINESRKLSRAKNRQHELEQKVEEATKK